MLVLAFFLFSSEVVHLIREALDDVNVKSNKTKTCSFYLLFSSSMKLFSLIEELHTK